MAIEKQVLVEDLTPQEKVVLSHLSNGLSNKQITEELTITENTVLCHCKHIYDKLGVRDRTQAALWGVHNLYNKAIQQQVLVKKLTCQEKRVLCLLKDGLSNQQIADRLVISLRTVKAHISNIFGKLGVSDRTQAALWGVHNLYYLEIEAAA